MKRPLETQRPASRANAESRANSKIKRSQYRGPQHGCEVSDGRISPGRSATSRKRDYKIHHIDFGAINRAGLAAFPAVLARILPGGKRVGAELVALNPRRADRHLGSFKVNRYNGRWADFATGDKGGDPISLVGYLADVSRAEGARLLARMLGLEGGRRRDE
jgi:hypothetical protein